MKKNRIVIFSFLGVLLISLLGLLIGIAYLSYKVERGFEGMLYHKVDPFFIYFSLEDVSVQSDFLSTKATSIWRDDTGNTFEVNHTVYHYPWDFSIYTKIMDPGLKSIYGFDEKVFIQAKTKLMDPDMPTVFSASRLKFKFPNGYFNISESWGGEFRISRGDLRKSINIGHAELFISQQNILLDGLVMEGVLFANKGGREGINIRVKKAVVNDHLMFRDAGFNVLGEYDDRIYSSEGAIFFGGVDSKLSEVTSESFVLDFKAQIPYPLYRNLRDAPGDINRGIFLSSLLSDVSYLSIDNFQHRYKESGLKNLFTMDVELELKPNLKAKEGLGSYYQGLLPYLEGEVRIDAPKDSLLYFPEGFEQYINENTGAPSLISDKNVRFILELGKADLKVNDRLFKDYSIVSYH